MKDLDMFVIEEDHKHRRGISNEEPRPKKAGWCKRHKKFITIFSYLYLFGWVAMHWG